MKGIYVWGTGCGASELIEKGLSPEKIDGFVDCRPRGSEFLGRPVFLPEALPAGDCGLLIVTVRQSEDVARECGRLGIPEDRILYAKNPCRLEHRSKICPEAAALLGQPLVSRLLPRQRILTEPDFLGTLPEEALGGDFVRLGTLELLCRRLEGIPGAAAELGVYRGGFARWINFLLPRRRLYLFDSFSGFLPGECPSRAFQEAHANTSLELVRKVLPHPEQAVFLPGYFPESLKGLEDRFCLVSLDVDFEESTLAGLRWFWPRLNPGGYLLLHDWGNPSLPGVGQALEAFQRERGEQIPGVPLPDLQGTLVLCKPFQGSSESMVFGGMPDGLPHPCLPISSELP